MSADPAVTAKLADLIDEHVQAHPDTDDIHLLITRKQATYLVNGLRSAAQDAEFVRKVEQIMTDEPEFAVPKIAALFKKGAR